jgi:hypothetical protein
MTLKHEEFAGTMNPTCRRNPRLAGSARTALLCAALALPGMVAAAAMPTAVQRVELAWKLEAGTDLVYRQSVHSETELPQGMGTSAMRSDSTQRWSVLEVDGDGNATVRLTTEGAQMSLDGRLGASIVDSAAQAIAGTSYTVVFDPRGVVVGMSGLEEMREAVRAQVADLSSLAMLDGMLSDEALRSQWAQGSLALPTEPVGIGSTWDSTYTTPIPAFGSMTAVTSYRVESMDGDLVVIGSSGTMSLAAGAAASLPVPVELGDATILGTSRFDAGKGLLLGTESTMSVQMSIAMGGQEMVIDTVTTVALELIEGGG